MRGGPASRILQLLSLELLIVGLWVLALPAHQAPASPGISQSVGRLDAPGPDRPVAPTKEASDR